MPVAAFADDALNTFSSSIADEIVELTSALVRTSSVSGTEAAVIDVARSYLEAHGVAVEVVARDARRPNLVATVGEGGPVLAYNGHLDTVPVLDPAAWRSDPLTAVVEGDRLTGLGSVDMKGPCAVMMLTAACLAKHSGQLRGSLQLQLVSDEEDGCYYGTIYLIEEMLAGRLAWPDKVISGEYTGLKIMNAERGSFKFKVTFHGVPTHTATARVEGVNPIRHAALAVLALDRPLDRFHPEVGYGVISPNIINGGHFVSSVPAECSIVVDRRILPGETDESALVEAEGWIREALRDHPEARFEIAPMVDANQRKRYSPPNVTAWNSPIVQSLVNAHERITKSKAEPFVDWFGVTDGRLFRYKGISTAAYGPTGAHFHGSNEYVNISALMTQLRVFVDVAFQTLGRAR
ncbi:MAG TPA: hypothetical protein DEV93_19425 [Chloroflexi bacterium]|nr:hypothetical protein [Chloroflexota bacterium]